MAEYETTLTDRIRSLGNEFHFATRCLQTAINDETDEKWRCYFNVPEPQGPSLFTDSIRLALLHIINCEIPVPCHIVFHSWFVENKVTKVLSKTLMDIVTASYLKTLLDGDEFLRHFAIMAELSALCYFAGVTDIPEYTIGCLLYVMKEMIDKNALDWNSIAIAAERYIKDAKDPSVYYQEIMKTRNSVLESYSSE